MIWQWKFKNILRLYSKWGKEITGEKIETAWSLDFSCFPDYPYKVWIAVLMAQKNIDDLPKFLKDNFVMNFNLEKFNMGTLCFLHEIGHILTDFEFSDEDKDYAKPITLEEYRMLCHEYAADEWVISYINDNGFLVYKWQCKIAKAYAKITEKDLEKFVKYQKFN